MTLPRKPFGEIEPAGYFSPGIENRYFGCANCGIQWELRRFSSDDPHDRADEGYYLSFYHDDTMTWLGPLHEDPKAIQTRVRRHLLNHPCFKKESKSNSFGCLSIILIVILAIVLISFLARALVVIIIIAPFAIFGLCIYGIFRYFRRKRPGK